MGDGVGVEVGVGLGVFVGIGVLVGSGVLVAVGLGVFVGVGGPGGPPYSCAPISGLLPLAFLKKSSMTSLIIFARSRAGEEAKSLNHSGVSKPGPVGPDFANCGSPITSSELETCDGGVFDQRL